MSRTFLAIPSTYGFAGWIVAIIFLAIGPVDVAPLSGAAYAIIAFTLVTYAVATLLFMGPYSRAIGQIAVTNLDAKIFAVTTILGGAALAIYSYKVTVFFGGMSNLIRVLTDGALAVRANAEEFVSAWHQVTYLSWISIFFGALMLKRRKLSFPKAALIFLVIAAEFALNLLFIDRTRPVWIIFIVAMGVLYADPFRKGIGRRIVLALAAPAVIFVAFAALVGKFNARTGIFGTMDAYISGGIGYMDDMLSSFSFNPDFELTRTFMPLSKVLEGIGVIGSVPSNILEFRAVPFFTNVGTIHEPYLSDGGILLMAVAFPAIVLFTNYLACVGLRDRTAFGLFIWANCSFSLLISFFVPKFNSTPFYLFVALFIVYRVLNAGSRPSRRVSRQAPRNTAQLGARAAATASRYD